MLGAGTKIRAGSLEESKNLSFAKAKVGSGVCFQTPENLSNKKAIKNAAGVAAALGRAKFSKEDFKKLAAKARRNK
jgi:hypothetical protein